MSSLPLITRIARNKRIQLIEKEIHLDWQILDLGCGDGWLTNQLVARGYDCIGVDKHIYPTKKEENTRLREEDISALSFPNNTFDCIIMIEVIEHIDPAAYREIERVLKPHGRIIVTTPLPSFNWFVELLAKFRFVNSLKTPHINLVRLEELGKRWKVLKKTSILVLDQFGVFQVNKA